MARPARKTRRRKAAARKTRPRKVAKTRSNRKRSKSRKKAKSAANEKIELEGIETYVYQKSFKPKPPES